MGNRRNGFTLVELLTAIVVMTIISGAAMMSLTAADQTAKREAERVQAYIYDLMRKADRAHVDFEIDANTILNNGHVTVKWYGKETITDTSFIPTDGCYYSAKYGLENKTVIYRYQSKDFNYNGTITVVGAGVNKQGTNEDKHYIKIHDGRIRLDDKP